MTKAVLGVIGGSGVYDLPGLEDVREERVETPWGTPSDALRIGRIGRTPVVFLPRHGRGHRLGPSDINYRANIDALKRAGVTDLVSLSACGSFRPELYPGLFVLVDQFVDRIVEARLVGEECRGQAVNRKGFGGHVTLRVVIGVEGAPGLAAVEHFDAADLDHAVAAREAQPRRLGIEYDLAHCHVIDCWQGRGKR